jgi:hypothetical protein
MVLGGKLGIDHMRELREKKCQSDLILLTIFSVRITLFFVNDFQCQNDLDFVDDFQCHVVIISVDEFY